VCWALNSLKRRFPARAVDGIDPERAAALAAEVLAMESVAALVAKPSTGSAALDIHLAMLLSMVGRQSEAALALSDADTDPSRVSIRFTEAKQLTVALCNAIASYTQRDYKRAAAILDNLSTEAAGDFWPETRGVDGLLPDAWRPMGLSNAQRDVFTQLHLRSLLNSAQGNDDDARKRAAAMIGERDDAGKDAALTGRLAMALRGEPAAAARL
jgi:hypothetical protein